MWIFLVPWNVFWGPDGPGPFNPKTSSRIKPTFKNTVYIWTARPNPKYGLVFLVFAKHKIILGIIQIKKHWGSKLINFDVRMKLKNWFYWKNIVSSFRFELHCFCSFGQKLKSMILQRVQQFWNSLLPRRNKLSLNKVLRKTQLWESSLWHRWNLYNMFVSNWAAHRLSL